MASNICELICAVLLPPVGVWMHTNQCGKQVCINILLCCLGYFPGIIHALIVICADKKPKPAATSGVPMGGQPGPQYAAHPGTTPQGYPPANGAAPQGYPPANASTGAPQGYPAAQPAVAPQGGAAYPPPQPTQPAGYPTATAAGTAAQSAPYPPASAV